MPYSGFVRAAKSLAAGGGTIRRLPESALTIFETSSTVEGAFVTPGAVPALEGGREDEGLADCGLADTFAVCGLTIFPSVELCGSLNQNNEIVIAL